eukprot:1542768-Rhodomonas_salina.1
MGVAASLDNMGLVYLNLGKNKEALQKHEEALRIRVKHVGHIGSVYYAQGENDLALAKHEESLRILVKNLGHNHMDVAASLNNIG